MKNELINAGVFSVGEYSAGEFMTGEFDEGGFSARDFDEGGIFRGGIFRGGTHWPLQWSDFIEQVYMENINPFQLSFNSLTLHEVGNYIEEAP